MKSSIPGLIDRQSEQAVELGLVGIDAEDAQQY